MLSKRQKELLEIMQQQDDFQTVDFFAKKLGVSKRTIHSELNLVEQYVNNSGRILEKKRGVGIVLKKLKEVSVEEKSQSSFDEYSVITRRIEIMKLWLFDQAVLSFNQLSEKFLVSKTSIKNDFTTIMKIIQVGNHLKLSSDLRGTRLVGTEEDFQKGLLQFNRYLFSNSDIYQEESAMEKIHLLEPYYGSKLVSACSNILYGYVRDNVNAISDYYVQNILSIFIILVYRTKQGFHLSNAVESHHEEASGFYKKSADLLLSKAAMRLQFSFKECDVEYLSQHLISNRFESLPDESVDDVLVEKLITKVSDSLHIQLSDDLHLEEQLRNHIPPMLYRLKSDNKTENPFTAQIKKEFSLTFNVIWVVLSEYESEVGIAFNEDEIAFLTMYFQAAIERAKLNRKILIVCQMGIATSELLVNRIKQILPSLDKLEVASVAELEQIDLDSYDLIISTIKIEVPNKAVLLVSPFLNEDDIQKISSYGYKEKKNKIKKQNQLPVVLKEYIHANAVFFNSNYSSRDDLIKNVGKDLIDGGYINEKFVDSVLNRENLGGTDLPTGTCVPHGNSIHVEETVIAVIKNKKKFRWNEYFVDLIFMICIAKKDTKKTREILSDIYHIIDTPEILCQIRTTESKEQLLTIIKE